MYIELPLYPGPSSVHKKALEALAKDYMPGRYSSEYVDAYQYICKSIKEMCHTENDVVILTGEAIQGLWTALRSTLTKKDKVLAVGTGVFGDGFADMAKCFDIEARLVSFPYNTTIGENELLEIEKAIDEFQPTMITLVHCETPSGTLNPLEGLGALKKKKNVPLFVVDAVSSMGGVPIYADDAYVDILIGGSQKCFSCPSDLTIMAISQTAWNFIDKVNYIGYDALKPYMAIVSEPTKFPYTPHTNGIFALAAVIKAFEDEGFEAVFKRQEEVANMYREGIKRIGLELYVEKNSIPSPTVTAVCVPQNAVWKEKQEAMAQKGLFLGGSLAALENKVFRIGHMGSQANKEYVNKALEIIEEVFK